MKYKPYNLRAFILSIFIVLAITKSLAESPDIREYQVKAAFLFNFTKFVDWPEEIMVKIEEPFIIGVMCEEKHEQAYEPLLKEQVKGKKVEIKYFHKMILPTNPEDDNNEEYKDIIQPLRSCNLLFICDSAGKQLPDIIRIVKDYPVLTVTETSEFKEDSSVMNFVKHDQKIRFEVSLTAAKKANVKVRSGLLKLAIRVLGQEQEGGK